MISGILKNVFNTLKKIHQLLITHQKSAREIFNYITDVIKVIL